MGGQGRGRWRDPEGAVRPRTPSPQSGGDRALGSDMFLSTGQQQLRLHACLLPLPHTHGLPHLPPREGTCPLPRVLCPRPWGGECQQAGCAGPLTCPLVLCRWTWRWWKWALVALTTAPTSSGEDHCFRRRTLAMSPGQRHHGPSVSCRKPVVCGVSSLGIDHTSLLGDTVEEIAWQKGGIFKVPGSPGDRRYLDGLGLALKAQASGAGTGSSVTRLRIRSWASAGSGTGGVWGERRSELPRPRDGGPSAARLPPSLPLLPSVASLPSRCSSLTVPWPCCGTVPSRSP